MKIHKNPQRGLYPRSDKQPSSPWGILLSTLSVPLTAGCLALLFGLLATVFATLLAARFGSFTAGLLAMLSTTLLAARTAAGGLIFGC